MGLKGFIIIFPFILKISLKFMVFHGNYIKERSKISMEVVVEDTSFKKSLNLVFSFTFLL